MTSSILTFRLVWAAGHLRPTTRSLEVQRRFQHFQPPTMSQGPALLLFKLNLSLHSLRLRRISGSIFMIFPLHLFRICLTRMSLPESPGALGSKRTGVTGGSGKSQVPQVPQAPKCVVGSELEELGQAGWRLGQAQAHQAGRCKRLVGRG